MLGHRLRREPPPGDPNREAGTSLVEAIIAMFVIATVFGGLAGLLIQSLSSLRGSKDFETATQLMNMTLEEARALPSDTLTAGALDTEVSSNVTGGQETRLVGVPPGPFTFNGETLRTTTSPSAVVTPLSPYRATETINNVTFTLSTYATECHQAAASPGTCGPTASPTTTEMTRVTVIVDWVQGASATPRSITGQTLQYSPTSCLSSATHPFSAPCQSFFYGNARAGGSTFAVTGGLPDATILSGSGVEQFNLDLPKASASIQSEQTASVVTQAAAPVISRKNTGGALAVVAGGLTASAQAVNDPTGGAPSQTNTFTAASQVQNVTGSGVTLRATGSATTGVATATTAASASPSCTTTTSVTTVVTGLPCGSANATPSAASTLTTLGTVGGVNIAATLGSSAAPGSLTPPPIRAHAGAYTTSGGTLCLAATTTGCMVGDAASNTGAVTLGGLPPTMARPGGFTNAVNITAEALTSAAERGPGSPVPGTPAATPTATAMTVWNGAGYTVLSTANLVTGASLTIPATNATSGGVVFRIVSGTVTVGPRVGTSDPSGVSPDCTSGCDASSSTTGIAVSITYEITNGGQVARFTVDSLFSASASSATYVTAPAPGS
jgi:Tfp pilus assembly protein PilV